MRVGASPVEQGFQHRTERPAFWGQEIFGAGRVLLVEAAFDNAGFFEALQPGRQRIRADAAERCLEILELARPFAQQVAQDQHRPALADDVDRASHGTAHIVRRRIH
jgi:hypothetical protein